jgi:hypothetical protein
VISIRHCGFGSGAARGIVTFSTPLSKVAEISSSFAAKGRAKRRMNGPEDR